MSMTAVRAAHRQHAAVASIKEIKIDAALHHRAVKMRFQAQPAGPLGGRCREVQVRPASGGVDHGARQKVSGGCLDAKRIFALDGLRRGFSKSGDAGVPGGVPESEIKIVAGDAGSRRVDRDVEGASVEQHVAFGEPEALVKQVLLRAGEKPPEQDERFGGDEFSADLVAREAATLEQQRTASPRAQQ